ncbi:MAG TPA: thiaminase II [Rhodospirillaceae bacterium]|jgi:thiaminase/transcriptional activator TenA|nr:thiaminase II [Alphaproteobacteria bacterium]HBH26674.1 thiaminase II [Rhodospirillaceae bacterium]
MTFCDTAWARVRSMIDAIYDLPFNQELASGTLSQERFATYMIQDSLYLVAFSRTLSLAAARTPSGDVAAMDTLTHAAREVLVAERMLHESYFRRFGVDPAQAAAAEMNPSCAAYTNFLLASAQEGSWGETVAAVLPCIWIYAEAGKHIAAIAAPDNPYQAWIDTYVDPGFQKMSSDAQAVANRAAAAVGAEARARMLERFVVSTRYEWMFWNAAYNQEDWPDVSAGKRLGA